MKTNCTWNKIQTLAMAYNIQKDLVLTRFVTNTRFTVIQFHCRFGSLNMASSFLLQNHCIYCCLCLECSFPKSSHTVFVTFSVGFQLNCYFLTRIFSKVPTSTITVKNITLFYCLHNMYCHPKLTHL